jgi:hypothetical protein
MAGILIYVILIFIVVVRFLNQKKKPGTGNRSAAAGTNPRRASGKGPLALDGHRVSKDQDISCRRYGHKHEEFDTPRFIPHEDPEEGYVVLNGVRMKLTEADNYENRI